MIAIGAVVAPVALVSAWAVAELTDTETFVDTFAPLGASDEVQQFLSGRVTAAIEEQIDFEAVSESIVGTIVPTDGVVGSLATTTLNGVVEQSVRQLVAGGVSRVVESEAFSTLWEESLRLSHTAIVSALSGTDDSALTLDGDGRLGIQLAPIIERVKGALVEGGLGFAAQIPASDRTVVIVQSDALANLQTAYRIATVVASWLPWLALALVAGGLFVAGASIRSLILSAGGVAVAMIVLLLGLGVGRGVVVQEFTAAGVPDTVASILFDQVVGGIYAASVTVIIVVLLIAGAAWLFGPFDVTARLRRRSISADATEG